MISKNLQINYRIYPQFSGVSIPSQDSVKSDNVLRELQTTLGIQNADITVYSPEGTVTKSIGNKKQFAIGSITKAFTSTIVLKLAEEGKLSIDDKITTHLPELKENLPNIEQATIKQLMNHTSGLADYTKNRNYIDIIEGKKTASRPEDFLSYLKNYYEKTNYSNTNYLILGKLIEQKTGLPLKEAFKRYIFTPLGLENTKLGMQGHIMPTLNIGFADGGIVSTSEDVTQFMKNLFIDKKFLNQQSINTMLDDNLGIISGKIVDGKAYGHAGAIGSIPGSSSEKYNSYFLYLPNKKKVLSILTSVDSSKNTGKFTENIESSLLKNFVLN